MIYKAAEDFFAWVHGEIIRQGDSIELTDEEAKLYENYLSKPKRTTQARVRRTS